MSAMTAIDDTPRLVQDHAGQQIPHAPWCREHVNYDPERSPLDGCCSDPIDLEFGPIAKGYSDVTAARVSVWACVKEQDRQPSTDVVWIGFNGSEYGDAGIAPWKCVPLAFALLAADAQARGDEASARSFRQMAQSAVAQHAGDAVRDRMETVDRARYSADYREGMLAAYRETGRPELVPALLEDMDYLDRFSPDEPPSMNRASVLPTTRTAPDGTILDLTRALVDRNGTSWFWGGYSVTGHPLVALHPEANEFWPVAEIWEKSGPFTQGSGGQAFPAEVYEAARAVAPDVPAFIVQPGREANTRRVVAVSTGKPVNDTVYTDADGNAPFDLRDQLNALPRRQVAR